MSALYRCLHRCFPRSAFLPVVLAAGFLCLPVPTAQAQQPPVPGPGLPEAAPLRAAIEDLRQSFPGRYSAAAFLQRLDGLEAQRPPLQKSTAGPVRDAAAEAFRAAFEALRREALLANPLLAEYPLLFVVRAQYRPDHHNTETMFQTNEINTGSFAGGSALKSIDLRPGGRVATLMEVPEGIVRDPEVHFSGAKIVFSLRRNIGEDYKIWEIRSDGTGLRPLTRAVGVTDIDPLYLPDDSIVFSSTREPKYCMCNVHIMANLCRMGPDGENIHQIGRNTLFEGHSTLMPDGRILYDRWEYVDRNFGDAQGLWTVNPDGTNHALYLGNYTPSPGGFLEGRVLPDSERALCILGSCHDRPWGALALLDRRQGLEGRLPIVRTWPPAAIDLAGTDGRDRWDAYTGVRPRYEDPFPLSDRHFLCARTIRDDEQMGIYLVDVFGNEVLVHSEGAGCYDPMPLRPAPRPPVLPVRRDYGAGAGTLYVSDVYVGRAMQGVERGRVKSLRVVETPEKRFWTQPGWNGQGIERPAMNWHDFSSKRILGTVPVESDGSAYFSLPSDRFVYFQLLDADGRMVQSMRSGTMVQSGEQGGCVGCHEDRLSSPPADGYPKRAALRRAPSRIDASQAQPFNFMEEVQPVFDRSCVRCHDYGKPAGAKLNLAGDHDLVFNTSYNELWRKGLTGAIGAGPAQPQPPLSWGSAKSRLFQTLLRPHKDAKIDPAGLAAIAVWLDLNAPFYPDYASAWPDSFTGRAPFENAQLDRLCALTGINLGETGGNGSNRGPQVAFERPERSPCLANLDPKGPAWAEAVALIRTGAKQLAARPNPDQPGFAACPLDRQREAKYQARAAIERRNRAAIREGRKVFDDIPSTRTFAAAGKP